MKQLSREQRDVLIKTANYMVERSDTSDYSESIRQVAMLALSCLAQEPVAYADPQAFRNFQAGAAKREWMWCRPGPDLSPLYSAPPAAVVDADDNFYSWFGREWHEQYQQKQYAPAVKQVLGVMAESAWKAGRAAMLQAGNSPVIPDCWIPCSERMPEVCKDVLIYVTNPNEVILAYLSHGGEFCYDTDGDGEQMTTKATHWQPLPAPPKDGV